MPSVACTLSGAYPVQPVGNPPISTLDSRMMNAAGVSQNDSASSRGNAIRLDPIISGIRKLPNGPSTTDDISIIIIVPCSPTTIRYVEALMMW